jgi:carbon-monoxide dehydrogenase medium subunit
MIPANFQYTRAGSVDEAIGMLKQHGDEAKLLAGGHSLLPAMKLRLNQPGVLIDIGRIPELRYIRREGDHVSIGAGATHDDVATSDAFGGGLEMFTQAAELIGDKQVRNKGTIGGSLAHADPAADWPAVVIASNATLVVKGPNGERQISAADFFTGFYETALAEDEILTEIRVPVPAAGTKSAYAKFMQPASRFAIVGCAAMITSSGGTCSNASIALTGVADAAYKASNIEEALKGKSLDSDTIKSATADAVVDGAMVMEDHFASEEYRTHLASVYASRAIRAAV